ncbi:MAG: FtsW/RodA/SpoVE family cell cycle protein, partial [bacterium]|nr:FtsW/RodA/SpoVE family cell cycle protein [bacterium]
MKKSRVEQSQFDHLLLAYLATILVGLVMVYSASSVWAESRHGSHYHFIQKQFIAAVLSLLVIWIIGRLDLRRLSVYSAPALLITLLLLSLVFIMPGRNGSHRWLMIGPLTAQPSELFKFVMIFYLAFSLANPKRNLGQLKQLLFPYAPLLGVGLLLILAEPDLGTSVVVFLTAVLMFFLAGAKMKHLLSALVPLIGTGSFVVFVLGYKRERVLDYIAALADPLQGSYQTKQAALSLGAGGLMGTGLGDGRQKLFFLPYPHTDFIFAAIGEEVGFIGLLLIMALLAFILYRGLKIAYAQ